MAQASFSTDGPLKGVLFWEWTSDDDRGVKTSDTTWGCANLDNFLCYLVAAPTLGAAIHNSKEQRQEVFPSLCRVSGDSWRFGAAEQRGIRVGSGSRSRSRYHFNTRSKLSTITRSVSQAVDLARSQLCVLQRAFQERGGRSVIEWYERTLAARSFIRSSDRPQLPPPCCEPFPPGSCAPACSHWCCSAHKLCNRTSILSSECHHG